MKFNISCGLSLLLTILCNGVYAADTADKPKNIIMLVGDGMGPAYTTAYRYFADNKNTEEVEQTVFDRLLVGSASTYPHQISGYITDSAAGATALATGVKTYNGAIAVDSDKKPLLTVLEWARQKGLKTGIAVTSHINHATPASYVIHNESRKNYSQIADSYFDEKINGKFKLDVMLGGGSDFFIREDRNLVEEFKLAGYQYVNNLEQLATIKTGQALLGLFGEEGMPWALDSKDKQRLPMLTEVAIKQLENEKGFFLLIEASQVDWAGHGNDIAAAMAEMRDLSLTLEFLEKYLQQHSDTLLVLTADHSTGGLTLGANGEYRWSPEWLTKLKASPKAIAKRLSNAKDIAGLAADLLGFELTDAEKKQLAEIESSDSQVFYSAIKLLLDERSNTGWTTTGHTGVDVQVFAKGKGAEMFAGYQDNTQIAERIFTLLGRGPVNK